MSKLAILQMADQGPAESTRAMLQTAGYRVAMPDDALREELRRAGCDLVLSPRDLTRGMGYDRVDFEEVGPEALTTCDLYCDVKAHRAYPHVVSRWPRLAGRVLWTRINGGRPEHVIKPDGTDCGDEVTPSCPVLTPNLWYAQPGPWSDRAYAAWPPFVRFNEYYPKRGRAKSHWQPPACLIHNVQGWGYGAMLPGVRELGVKVYGAGSPDGLVNHYDVPNLLSNALAYVHLKSSDAPGYSLYEALAAACPVVCTRRLIWRCRMGDLFVPGETCLVFDRETHDGLSEADVAECLRELSGHLERLRDPAENERLGLAGRARLAEVMWDAKRDGPGLAEWMGRMFP